MKDLFYRKLVKALVNEDAEKAKIVLDEMKISPFYDSFYNLDIIRVMVDKKHFYQAYQWSSEMFNGKLKVKI